MYELKMGYVGAVWPVDEFQHVRIYLNIGLGFFCPDLIEHYSWNSYVKMFYLSQKEQNTHHKPVQLFSIYILSIKLFIARFELEKNQKRQGVFSYSRVCVI